MVFDIFGKNIGISIFLNTNFLNIICIVISTKICILSDLSDIFRVKFSFSTLKEQFCRRYLQIISKYLVIFIEINFVYYECWKVHSFRGKGKMSFLKVFHLLTASYMSFVRFIQSDKIMKTVYKFPY